MKNLIVRAAVLWSLVGARAAAGPVEAIAAAEADAARLPPAVAQATRYLWMPRPDTRQEVIDAARYWSNATSTEFDIIRPRLVGPELLALHVLDYGADKLVVWEKFADEPYFHERIAVPTGATYTSFWRQGKGWGPGFYSQKATQALVFSLPTRSMGQDRLAVYCNSAVPILRADWWIAQVGQQVDRKVGYYDWLGVGKKRDDFDKLVGFSKQLAQARRKETMAIVPESIVALHNRQIVRFGMIDGAYWQTLDAKSNDGERNALRLLDQDRKHDAEEIIASLPNGLHAFFLSDVNGARADSAPDFIASDRNSGSPDRRVHAGISCVRCHVEGIRPINDWARRAYDGPDRLNVLDPVRQRRLSQLYLSDINRLIKRDQDDYEEAMRRANGLSVGDNAKVVAAVWAAYFDEPVTLESAAVELGLKSGDQLAAILRMVPAGRLDPVAFSLGKRNSIPIRREHFEELFQRLWSHVVEQN